MNTEQTYPGARANCETCGATFENRRPLEYTERIAEARQWAERHATKLRHDVFVEKITGTMYRGSR